MNAPERHAADWVESNQRLLAAEFKRLKRRLAEQDDTLECDERDALRAVAAAPPAVEVLATALGLSAFEKDIVLLTAGVEMDSQLAALCARAAGNQTRPWATFGLALAVLAEAHWSALTPLRPLRRWRVIELDENASLTTARLRLDERVLHFLAGIDCGDSRWMALVQPVASPRRMPPTHQLLGDAIAESLRSGSAPPAVQLYGEDSSGREDVAAFVARSLGYRLEVLDVHALPAAPADVALLTTLWEREALLSAKALLIECSGDAPSPGLRYLIERVHGLIFIGAHQAIALRRPMQAHYVRLPTSAEQRALWNEALADQADSHTAELDAVVSQFRCSARRIADTAASLGGDSIEPGVIWQACREASPARLAELAQRVDASVGWDDLVVPQAQRRVLEQIVVHMRRRFEVHDAWGFAGKLARGLGVTALFAGESGTGKTLAAEVLARTLQLELYRIDLSAVVSKYIGETEKNLRRVFDAAEDSGAILLFDEADALFGKRSDVKDSHDRYANIEVSYLLQRMESYCGLAILTTNHKGALDAAFMRRLRFVVQFPFPEAAEREAIWRRAFPALTPTRDLAYAKLARLQVAGGLIQNIALAAAFDAAEAAEPVGMAHLLRAAYAESAKRERAVAEGEVRGWV